MKKLFDIDTKGTHEDGCGWDPNGNFCGECGSGTCEDCPIWDRNAK